MKEVNEYKSYICERCGKEFLTNRKIRVITCSDCRAKIKYEKQVKYNQSKATVWRKKEKIKSTTNNLFQLIKDVEKYNKNHGTHLTYGQYTALTNK